MLNNVYTCKQKYDKFAPKFLKVYFAFYMSYKINQKKKI